PTGGPIPPRPLGGVSPNWRSTPGSSSREGAPPPMPGGLTAGGGRALVPASPAAPKPSPRLLRTISAMRLTPADLARLFGGRLEGAGEPSAPLVAIEPDPRTVR